MRTFLVAMTALCALAAAPATAQSVLKIGVLNDMSERAAA